MNTLVLLAAGSLASLAALSPLRNGQSPPRDGLFIHVTHGADDPHRALMARKMAMLMAGDHDVLVYFDIQAIDLVLANGPAVRHEGFPPAREQMKELVGSGATLMACPTCLKIAGETHEALAAGVKLADKDAFFNFTKGRVLSLDY